jgi:S1-C subfamily serine protease
VTVEGFAKALQGALELHAKYPANKDVLAAKRGAPVSVKAPEDLPAFKGKFRAAIDYEGQVAKSCIHCHQVGEAMRMEFHGAGKPIPQELLFPYPNPKVLGLVMDPKERARVASVGSNSAAEQCGFRAGDEITAFAGQPVLSIADLQWVLHHAGDGETIATEVSRDGKPVALGVKLAPGWRTHDDIAWRATSWDLRRMVSGGLVLEDMSNEARNKAGVDDKTLALQVVGVGQYGEHATAKKIGFREGDILVALDGNTSRRTESEWLTSLASSKKRGDQLRVKLRRGAEELELTLPVQ